MSFGENLKNLRRVAGLTQAEVAEKLGIKQRAYAAYEADESFPKDQERLLGLSMVLNASVDEMLQNKKSNDDEVLFRAAGLLIRAIEDLDTSGGARDAVMKCVQDAYWARKKQSKKIKIRAGEDNIYYFLQKFNREDINNIPGYDDEPNVYIWGTPEDERAFNYVWHEFFDKCILRQGWGGKGMDVRLDYQTIERSWYDKGWPLRECKWRTKKFEKMLDIKPGDIIIVKNVYRTPNRESCCFALAECTSKYSFSPNEEMDDYGHMIGATAHRFCKLSGNKSPMYQKIWFGRGPHGRSFDKLDKIKDRGLIKYIKELLYNKT